MADSVLLNGKTVSEKERNYGIDLLRILSMFMVVVLHVNKYRQQRPRPRVRHHLAFGAHQRGYPGR